MGFDTPHTYEELIRKDGVYITFSSGSRFRETIRAHLDGFSASLSTGVKASYGVERNGTILSSSLYADQVGDVVIDIWKDDYANYPPTDADSITGGNEPTISSDDKYQDTTLTDWETRFSAGDVFLFNVDSASSITWVDSVLEVEYDLVLNQLIFTAYHPMEVVSVSEVHTEAGTDVGTVTLDIEKLTGTQAIGAGTSVLTDPFNLKSTANTPVTKRGTSLSNGRVLKPTDRLAVSSDGILAGVDGVEVTIYLKFYGRGDYL